MSTPHRPMRRQQPMNVRPDAVMVGQLESATPGVNVRHKPLGALAPHAFSSSAGQHGGTSSMGGPATTGQQVDVPHCNVAGGSAPPAEPPMPPIPAVPAVPVVPPAPTVDPPEPTVDPPEPTVDPPEPTADPPEPPMVPLPAIPAAPPDPPVPPLGVVSPPHPTPIAPPRKRAAVSIANVSRVCFFGLSSVELRRRSSIDISPEYIDRKLNSNCALHRCAS